MRIGLIILFFAAYAGLMGATIAGQDYVGLRSSGKKLGMTAQISADKKKILLTGTGNRASFTLHQRQFTLNGTKIWLNFPIATLEPHFYISRLDYERTLLPLIRPQAFSLARYRVGHIVLDPGHGGRDTGAENKALKINEKTFTLDVARRMKQRLEALGYKVTLTRNEDRFVELRNRPRLANTLKADLFISIHFNAVEDRSIYGIENYLYTSQGAPSSSRADTVKSDSEYQAANRQDIANLWLAYEVQRSMVGSLKTKDRAVRRARFAVLEDLRCPGILVEGGYISNMSEGTRLSSGLYRQQIANAIVTGIQNYQQRLLGGN